MQCFVLNMFSYIFATVFTDENSKCTFFIPSGYFTEWVFCSSISADWVSISPWEACRIVILYHDTKLAAGSSSFCLLYLMVSKTTPACPLQDYTSSQSVTGGELNVVD